MNRTAIISIGPKWNRIVAGGNTQCDIWSQKLFSAPSNSLQGLTDFRHKTLLKYLAAQALRGLQRKNQLVGAWDSSRIIGASADLKAGRNRCPETRRILGG